MKRILQYASFVLLLQCSNIAFSQALQDSTGRNSLDNLIMRSVAHELLFPQERVYLHFDNNSYFLTENIWFKAYITSGTGNTPTTLSKVLYVELVAPEGYVIRTDKYHIGEDGTCWGNIYLDQLYLSGYYEIRAYTRYMLNWGDEAIFSRVFPVFDKVNNGDYGFRNMLDRRRAFLVDTEKDSTATGLDREVEWVTSRLPELDLKMFPESGHLVNGLESTVAYEIFGADGINSNSSITLLADGEELLTSAPFHQGKGIFRFAPDKETRYQALLHIGNEKKRFDLPEIAEEGAVITVNNSDNGIVGISIKNNFETECELGCAILHRGVAQFYERFSSKRRSIFFAIDNKTLTEGVNRVVLFINDSIPLAERQFFVTHDSIVAGDGETVRLVANTTLKQPQPYEKVSFTIERKDGKPIEGDNFSLSITDACDNIATSYNYNIYTYMLLGSELKGYIPDAASYFDPDNSNRHKELDLVMLTHGWTSYDWAKLSQKHIALTQPIEKGITIKGRFIRKTPNRRFGQLDELEITNLSNQNINFRIAYDDSIITQYQFRTDANGEFRITTDDFTGKRIGKLSPLRLSTSHRDSIFCFALDRYFSPQMRLYDYWERNPGLPLTIEELSEARAEAIKITPFEYLLSQVEVVARNKREAYARPPRSELRLDFLDEWEYAQDVTYLTNKKSSWGFAEERINAFHENYRDISLTPEMNYNPSLSSTDSYYISQLNNIGSPHTSYAKGQTSGFRHGFIDLDISSYYMSDPALSNSLNAADILRSAFWRHNFNWCYWIHSMVVDGEYSSDSVPTPDYEYLKGVDHIKMMNFSEIVIRSDEKTRNLFRNFRQRYGRYTIGTYDYSDFYDSFTNRMPINARNGDIDKSPDATTLFGNIHTRNNKNMDRPNYVACFIPYKDEPIIPILTNNINTRYTMVYGYTESKEFYSPDYSTMRPDSSDIDYRRTLLWSPEVTVCDGKIEVEFYNNSQSKEFYVNIEGYSNGTFYSNAPNFATREFSCEEERRLEIDRNITHLDGLNTMELLVECFKKNEEARELYRNQEFDKAFTLFHEAATFGYPTAVFNTGLCYITGKGIEQDRVKGFQYIRKAANLEVEEALHSLAICYFHGIGTEQNDSLAIEYYKLSAEKGYAKSQAMLAGFYLTGHIVEQDSTEAYRLYSLAADNGEPTALYQMAEYYAAADSLAGLSKRKLRRQPAIEYYRQAAEKGNVNAQYKLGRFYETGYYVRRSKKQAFKWFQYAANKYHPQAIERVAYYYERGIGTDKDENAAAHWYRIAREQGSTLAKEKMEWYEIFRFFE